MRGEILPLSRYPIVQVFIILTTGWLLISILACSGIGNRSPTRFVPITNLKEVAGKWEGKAKKGPHLQGDSGWVTVSIRENGTFVAAANSTTGMLVGAGVFRLESGRLITETEIRRLTFTRYEENGLPLLIAEGTAKDGAPLHIELTPAK